MTRAREKEQTFWTERERERECGTRARRDRQKWTAIIYGEQRSKMNEDMQKNGCNSENIMIGLAICRTRVREAETSARLENTG